MRPLGSIGSGSPPTSVRRSCDARARRTIHRSNQQAPWRPHAFSPPLLDELELRLSRGLRTRSAQSNVAPNQRSPKLLNHLRLLVHSRARARRWAIEGCVTTGYYQGPPRLHGAYAATRALDSNVARSRVPRRSDGVDVGWL
ncbi:Hypothetical protein A7982_05778 [Minicystis rosea]|nr:Hypothetical protein A7982_05778 [Minicystis rosea]